MRVEYSSAVTEALENAPEEEKKASTRLAS
jgi:hypothetical protein